jgi:hypothetical protein
MFLVASGAPFYCTSHHWQHSALQSLLSSFAGRRSLVIATVLYGFKPSIWS